MLSFCPDLLASTLTCFRQRYPEVEVVLFEGSMGEVSEWIATIEVDLVTVDEVAAEGETAGFVRRPTRRVPETNEWVGSNVVVLEAV